MSKASAAEEINALQKRIRKLEAFLDASSKLTSILDLKLLITDILATSVEVFEIESSSLWLLEPDTGELVVEAVAQTSDEESFEYRLKVGEGIAGKVAQTGEHILLQSDGIFPPRSMLCVPLRSREVRGIGEALESGILGVMVMIHCEGQTFSESDIELIRAFANLAATAINNQRLFEEVEDTLYTVQTLADAIDIKDKVTYGHSRRVTETALAIYEQMEEIPQERKYLELASLLHDVGKIGIREDVLMKPGRLTTEEYEHMKEHTEIGYQLVKRQRFLQRIVPAVLYNQERYDGKGYPKGLKGEEIPISARIISVADAFDAMTNDRPYRKAMDVHESIQEIVANSGTQFDPQVVGAFLKALEKGKIKVARRQGDSHYAERK